MKEQLVEFETAKLAKDKGFNWATSCGYEENGEIYRPQYWEPGCETDMTVLTEEALNIDCDAICLAPTQALLQRWLYEKHQIWVNSQPLFSANEQIGVNLTITSWRFPCIVVEEDDEFDVYGGLEEVLQQALKLIK